MQYRRERRTISVKKSEQERAVIGGNLKVSNEIWALSIVRKKHSEHAFLILEGISKETERHVILRTDLFIDGNAKAYTSSFFPGPVKGKSIIIPKEITREELSKLEGQAIYNSWEITTDQVSKLLTHIDESVKEATEGKMGYCLMGNGSIYGSSFLTAKSFHNCVSWCKSQLKKIGITPDGAWYDFILVKGTNAVPGSKV